MKSGSESKTVSGPSSKGSWTHGTLTYSALGLGALLFWLLWGDVAWSLRDRSVPSVTQLLFQKFGASNLVCSLLISSLPYLLILVIGPMVSYRSDRTRSKWGRRIPFLAAHIPFAVLAVFAVGLSPQIGAVIDRVLGGSSPGLSTCILVVVAVGWSVFELATVVANAVFYGLINDVVPTSLLGRFYGIFRGISLLASILFNYFVFGHAEGHFPLIFMGIGVVYGVSFGAMCLRVKEGTYAEPPPIKEGEGGFLFAVRTYFRECFSKPYYLWVFASIAAPWIAFTGVNGFSVFFAKSLAMDMTFYGKCLALTYTCSLVLSYPLGMLADRFHPLRTSLVTLFFYVLATLGGALFAKDPTSFAVFFVAHGVLSGAWFTSSASLPLRMFPRARFSQFYSALFMFIGLGIMLAGPLVGQALDLTHSFYRLCFVTSCGIALAGLILGILVHGKFMRLGGPINYQAPE